MPRVSTGIYSAIPVLVVEVWERVADKLGFAKFSILRPKGPLRVPLNPS
jgi:hypothetical protein